VASLPRRAAGAMSAFDSLYKKPPGVDTIYARMGGEIPLEKVVDGVYKMMLADPEIGKQFARFRLERLKDRTVDYLRGEFGGEEYKGSDLWISHSHLGVKDSWYDIMMKYYDVMLKKCKIDKQVAKEICEAIEAMRNPICDPGQKFKQIYLLKADKEARQSQKENDERERIRKAKEVERAGRMAELRRAREAVQAGPDAGRKASPSPRPSPPGSQASPKPGASPMTSPSGSPTATMEVQETPPSRPRAEPSKRKPAVETKKFLFNPAEDEPPCQIPSSLPSGAEMIYRLQYAPAARPAVRA